MYPLFVRLYRDSILLYERMMKKVFFFCFIGSMFASIASIEVLGTIIASVGENAVYSATVSFMNGFVFLVMAVCICVNLSLLV